MAAWSPRRLLIRQILALDPSALIRDLDQLTRAELEQRLAELERRGQK